MIFFVYLGMSPPIPWCVLSSFACRWVAGTIFVQISGWKGVVVPWSGVLQVTGLVPCTHVLNEQTTSSICSNFNSRVEKKKKKVDTCCLTWIRMVCYRVKSCPTMSCLAEWAEVTWRPPPTPICQVVLTEEWLWHAVSLWWRNWNMIMIPDHKTSMMTL